MTSRPLQIMSSMVGEVIAGKYFLTKILGAGGNGTVFEARHVDDGRRFALKLISVDNPNTIARFKLEVEALCMLDHANTVRIFDWGEIDEGVFLVMELLQGGSLSQVLQRDGTIAPARAAQIAYQVCLVLKAAHHQNIIHRDIKPGNIFLVQTGQTGGEWVKVLDFGIAKIVDVSRDVRVTQTGHIVGSPLYSSPEQIQGGAIDHRSDFYSLGCVLYHMLAGASPFEGKNTYDVLIKQVREQPVTLDERRRAANLPPLDPALEALVQEMLSKSPEGRPSDATALLQRLEELIESGSLEDASSFNPYEVTETIESPPLEGEDAFPAPVIFAIVAALLIVPLLAFALWDSGDETSSNRGNKNKVSKTKLAAIAYKEGDCIAVLSHCRDRFDWEDATECHRLSGECYKKMGAIDMACASFNKALETSGGNHERSRQAIGLLRCGGGPTGAPAVESASGEVDKAVSVVSSSSNSRHAEPSSDLAAGGVRIESSGVERCSDALSRTQANELFKKANKQVFKGANRAAIANCGCALKHHPVTGCHRIMAIAYKNSGNKKKACDNFAKALALEPRNKAALENQVAQLGCKERASTQKKTGRSSTLIIGSP